MTALTYITYHSCQHRMVNYDVQKQWSELGRWATMLYSDDVILIFAHLLLVHTCLGSTGRLPSSNYQHFYFNKLDRLILKTSTLMNSLTSASVVSTSE
jgi:hypothetical protein